MSISSRLTANFDNWNNKRLPQIALPAFAGIGGFVGAALPTWLDLYAFIVPISILSIMFSLLVGAIGIAIVDLRIT